MDVTPIRYSHSHKRSLLAGNNRSVRCSRRDGVAVAFQGAKAIGLTGKMTAIVADEELQAKLNEIAANIGAYPHGALVNPGLGATSRKSRARGC